MLSQSHGTGSWDSVCSLSGFPSHRTSPCSFSLPTRLPKLLSRPEGREEGGMYHLILHQCNCTSWVLWMQMEKAQSGDFSQLQGLLFHLFGYLLDSGQNSQLFLKHLHASLASGPLHRLGLSMQCYSPSHPEGWSSNKSAVTQLSPLPWTSSLSPSGAHSHL